MDESQWRTIRESKKKGKQHAGDLIKNIGWVAVNAQAAGSSSSTRLIHQPSTALFTGSTEEPPPLYSASMNNFPFSLSNLYDQKEKQLVSSLNGLSDRWLICCHFLASIWFVLRICLFSFHIMCYLFGFHWSRSAFESRFGFLDNNIWIQDCLFPAAIFARPNDSSPCRWKSKHTKNKSTMCSYLFITSDVAREHEWAG